MRITIRILEPEIKEAVRKWINNNAGVYVPTDGKMIFYENVKQETCCEYEVFAGDENPE